MVKESNSGVKHTLSIKKILPCDLAGSNEQETTLKYNSLSEEEKKQVEEILFLLDKFCVGDSFFHELTMVTDGLPKSYLIQQCRANLNKLCHIDSLPGKAPGAKVSAVKELIKEHVEEYLRGNPATEKIQIKINGDGARMTRNSSFVLLSFSILQTGDQVMTAKGNGTLAILNGKEDYTSLKESFGSIFSEINSMITEAKVTIGHTEIKTEFFLGGDYKFILIMLGLNGATANYACAWCKIHKDDRWKTDEHFTYFNSKPLSRSLQEMREMSKKSKDNYACCKEPFLHIELDHIIVDELHLLLRITDVLTSNLITEVIDWDIEESILNTSNKQAHLNKLINSIRSCGVSFNVWKKKNADGKESSVHDWTSLMGNDKKALLYHLPEKMTDFLRPETAEKIIKIWVTFAALYKRSQ